jgi:hypothetical protein
MTMARSLSGLALVSIASVFAVPAHAFLLNKYGDQNEAQLGSAVAAVGDLNGDGYPDFAVGESADQVAGTGHGRVFIYFGGPSVHTVPDLVLGAGLAVTDFGQSISGGKDVNGDGYPDLIVGAEGDAYVYLGGPNMDNVPDWILSAPAGAAHFGYRVALIGDHNGDGFADMVVSAPSWTYLPTATPHVYVYDGGPVPHQAPDEVLDQPGSVVTFGASLAPAGDVNGDGYADFLVSELSTRFETAGPSGSVYLYLGGPSPHQTPDRTFATHVTGDEYGASVASLGDLNHDGYDDIVIGAPGATAPGLPAGVGMIQVFYGGPSMDTNPDFSRWGASGSTALGSSLAAGDVNADGTPDILVGTGEGNKVGIYYGGPFLHLSADKWIADPGSELFGREIAVVGDLDGDGLPEVLIGAPHYSVNPTMIWEGEFVLEASSEIVGAPVTAPHTFAFLAPTPNPARDQVALTLTLDHADRLTVEAFNASGRLVARPVADEQVGPGPISREWSLKNLPSGIYWVRARFANRNVTQRLVHLQGP